MRNKLLKLMVLLLSVGIGNLYATTCANATAISLGTTTLTCGTSNDIASQPCGTSSYDNGLEALYTYTPTNSGTLSIAYSGQTYSGIFVWNGCPSTAGTACVGTPSTSTSSTNSRTVSVTAGVTYYIMFDTWPSPASPCPGTATLSQTVCGNSLCESGETSVTCPGDCPPPPGDNCTNAQDLSTLTSPLSSTTSGYTNDFNEACISNTAPDRIFYIDVPSNYTLYIGQSTNGYDSKHRIAYGGACPGTTLINTGYLNNFPTTSMTGTSNGCLDDDDLTHYYFNNTTGSTQRVYYLLDGYLSNSGTFTLEWQLTAPPACVVPTLVTSSPVSTTATNVSWTCSGCTGTYIIEYGAAGFTPGTGATAGTGGTLVTSSSSPVSLTGLSATAITDIYVRQNCGGSYSANSSVAKFLPGDVCANAQDLGVLTSPLSSTTVGYADNFNETCISNTAPDRIFYIDVPSNYTLYIGQSTNGYDSKHRIAYGGACPGTTLINTGYVNNFPTTSMTGTSNGCLDDDDLTHYYFNNTTGSTQRVYYLLDGYSSGSGTFTLEWQLTAPPACIAPTTLGVSNLTSSSADFTWACSSCTGTYEIEYGSQGFTQGTGTVVTSATSPKNVSGLTSGNYYSFYVRQDCGGGSYSTWTGPYTFRVPNTGDVCGLPIVISSIPYTTTDNTSNYGDDYDVADRPALTGAQVANGTGIGDYLIGDDVVYSFTPASTGCYNINLSGLGTWVGVFLFEGCAPFTSTVAYHTNSSGTTRSLPNVTLTGGTTYYIVISTFAAPQSTPYTLTVEACPTCPVPTALSSNTTTTTTTNLAWTSNAGSSLFDIYYGTSPLTAPTALTTPTVNDYNGGAGASITYSVASLSPATTYQFYVREDCGGGDVSSWAGPISVTTLAAPPANDECSGAIALTVNADYNCGVVAAGTTNGATASAQADDVTGTPNNDVWYSFIATNSSHRISLTNIVNLGGGTSTSTDMGIGVYTGTSGCASLVWFDDSDPETLDLTGLTVGNTYFVRVYGWYSDIQNNNFNVCVGTTPPPPANDEISGAIAVSCGSVTSGYTIGGTQGTDESGTCGTIVGAPGVWYSILGNGDDVTVSLCGADYDSKVNVYTGTSGALVCVGGEDDDYTNCGGNDPFYTFPSITGTTYLILVNGFSGNTGNFDLTVSCSTPPPAGFFVWDGSASNDWTDGSNWQGNVAPSTCADNVFIADVPNMPIVTGSFTCGDLVTATNSDVEVQLTGAINVCGNATFGNGFIGSGDGSIHLTGNGGGTNVVCNGTAVLSNLVAEDNYALLSGNLELSNSLTLDGGNFTNSGGTLTLLSDASGTAYLDDFTNPGNAFVGNLKQQRYITPGVGLGQRYFGSAVNNGVVSGLDATYTGYPLGQLIPNGCDPNQLAVGSPYSNLFEWHENATFATSCVQEGWFAISAGTALNNARGYSGWMNDGSTLEVNGTPNTGALTYGATSITSSGVTDAQGWHLLSNPYPSPMDIDAVYDDGFTSPQYYNASSGAYSGTFQPVLVSGSEVPIMQGFVAQTSGSAFTPNNTYRVASNNANFYKDDNWFTYKLAIEVEVNGMADATYLFYDNDATNDFDNRLDCVKRNSKADRPTLFTLLETEHMSLNGYGLDDLGKSIGLGLVAPLKGTYSFNFNGMETFPENTSIYIEDKFANVFHNVNEGSYVFEADNTVDNSSRFSIHYVLPIVYDLTEPTCQNPMAVFTDLSQDERAFNLLNHDDNSTLSGNLNGLSMDLLPGNYTLTVFDTYGGNQNYLINVNEIVPVTIDIAATAIEIEVGETINFDAIAGGANDLNWTINGIDVAQTELMTYTFNEAGIYLIELFGKNLNCEANTFIEVQVNEKTTGIRTVNESSISLYSSNNDVFVGFNKLPNETATLQVYDILGNSVYGNELNTNEKHVISLDGLTTGLYLVVVRVGKEEKVLKVIIK